MLSSYTLSIVRLTQLSIRTFSVKAPIKVNISKQRLLYSKGLTNAQDLHQVWALVGAHKNYLDKSNILDAIRTVQKVSLSMYSDQQSLPESASKELMKNENFKWLCRQASQFARKMKLSDLCELVTLFKYFSLPPESKVFNELLKLLQKRVEELDHSELVEMNLLLKQLSESFPDNPSLQTICLSLNSRLESNAKVNVIESSSLDLKSLTAEFRTAVADKLPKSSLIELFKNIYTRRHNLSHSDCINCLIGIGNSRDDLLMFDARMTAALANLCLEKTAHKIEQIAQDDICFIFETLFPRVRLNYNRIWMEKAAQVYNLRFQNAPGANMQFILNIFEKFDHRDDGLLKLVEQGITKTWQRNLDGRINKKLPKK